jgi:hypothetical protein
MECPVCKQAMERLRWDISYNHPDAKNKEYDRTVYRFEMDDVWVTTEIPRADSNK